MASPQFNYATALDLLRKATPEDHPWTGGKGDKELGAPFTRLSNALADFVEVYREVYDYEGAIANVHSLVDVLPGTDEPRSTGEELLRAIFGANAL